MNRLSGLKAAPLPKPRPSVIRLSVPGIFRFLGSALQGLHDPDEFWRYVGSNHTRAAEAALVHNVSGSGCVVAVIDTGCRADHVGFSKFGGTRVQKGVHFFQDDQDEDTDDMLGHGTAVCGIIASGHRDLLGIAPAAEIVPLKMGFVDGSIDLSFAARALEWVVEAGIGRGVTAVNMSLGDSGNYPSADKALADMVGVRQTIADLIAELRSKRVPVVAPSGNYYAKVEPVVGMSFPAILPACFSAGTVFTRTMETSRTYPEYGEATVLRPRPDMIAPFSQRLPKALHNVHFTRAVAAGAPIESLGHESTTAVARDLHGTSLAAPMVTGVIALLQEKHREINGSLPNCDQLETWLAAGAVAVTDDYGDDDNVENTGAAFARLDALGALDALLAVS